MLDHGEWMTPISLEVSSLRLKVNVKCLSHSDQWFPIDNSSIIQPTFLMFGRTLGHSEWMTSNYLEVNRSKVKVIQYCYVPNSFRSITYVLFNVRSSYLIEKCVMVSR